MSFIAHMATSLKNNKRARVSAFKKMKNFKEGQNIKVSFEKKATPQQLKKIREELKEEKQKKFKKNILIFTITMVLLIYVIGFVKI